MSIATNISIIVTCSISSIFNERMILPVLVTKVYM